MRSGSSLSAKIDRRKVTIDRSGDSVNPAGATTNSVTVTGSPARSCSEARKSAVKRSNTRLPRSSDWSTRICRTLGAAPADPATSPTSSPASTAKWSLPANIGLGLADARRTLLDLGHGDVDLAYQ